MAVPKRRTSKTRRDKRRTHYKATATGLVPCPACKAPKMPHRVCGSCGEYNGRKVIAEKA